MADKKLSFQAKIQGREAGVVAAIAPPVDVIEYFGTRDRVPIRGTINGFPFRSSLMPCGNARMMPVNKTLCQGAGVRPGDIVDVVMERDEQERTVEPPPELKKELAKSKKAQERWDELAFTTKKEMAMSISGAKQEETKKRRLAKVMQVLEDRGEVAGLTTELFHHLSDVVLLKQTNAGDAGGPGFETRAGVGQCYSA